ncbi:hypothetical protein L1049_011573 [Liquidambar formosana]|uniref:Delta(3)-Delta(2)-enoyl-CoA isomerase n=1 Tax=Liquidambar formosana TaxID=63359 RepID=A0AAP0RS08_LIQFO
MCTLEKRGSLFVLTLTGADEHRLNPTLLDAISAALRRVKAETSTPSAIITTAQGKFFSNGYDLAWAKSSGPAATYNYRFRLISSKLRSLVTDLVSLPMPTIAAISGHASAAGFLLALCHDYVLMRKDRGFLYMSELDVGLNIPACSMAVLRCKIGSPAVRREVALRAAKLTAKEAVDFGVIDSAHDSAEETVEAAMRLGKELVGRKWDGHVYGEIRTVVMSEVLEAIAAEDEGSTATASRL